MAESEFPTIELKNGATLRIEASRLTGAPPKEGQDVRFEGKSNFDKVFTAIEGFAQQLNEVLVKVKPKSAKITFGVELGIESGQLTALIVKGTGKANLEITLEWA